MFVKLYEELQEAVSTYYHITQKDFGYKVKFKPRIPVNASEDEPNIPRTCVAPTVEGCFAALGNVILPGIIYVYKVQGNPVVFNPKGVPDFKITGEKWLQEIVLFKKVDTIKESDISDDIWDVIERTCVGRKNDENQKKLKKIIKQWFSKSLVSETFEEDEKDDGISVVLAPMNFDRARK